MNQSKNQLQQMQDLQNAFNFYVPAFQYVLVTEETSTDYFVEQRCVHLGTPLLYLHEYNK